MPEEYRSLVNKIYEGDLKAGMIDPETANAQAADFMKGVADGYGKSFGEIDYDTPDYQMLSHLQKNVYQFSGAKNYQELKALTEALYDGDRLRSKKEFYEASKGIVHDFNKVYRDAEYDTAFSSAQMAGKWAGFKANADIMPLLKFVAIADEHECPICRPFNNVVRPIDDAFWKYAYPVLHWRCRCNVLQLPNGEATADADVPGDETIPKMFRTNMAESGLVFPKDHPYYTGVPKKVLKQYVKENLPKEDGK